MNNASKLYVIVKNTLSAGLKAAQAVHAARAFAAVYPDLEKSWFEVSNNVVVLEHDNLDDLANRLDAHGLALARFHEPDRDNELTAICVEPEARKSVSRLALAI